MNMPKLLTYLIVLTSLFASAPGASARTWHVEQDGTGDYSVIQDAVNAAESGDVIEIGPGWYREYTEINIPNNVVWGCHIYNTVPDLTFVGDGVGHTIIGLEDGEKSEWYTVGICSTNGVESVRLFDVEFIHCSEYAIYQGSGLLEMNSCGVVDSRRGIFGLFPGGATVTNCEFVNLTDMAIATQVAGGMSIDNCTFDNCREGFLFQWSSSADCDVTNCTFIAGDQGWGGGLYNDGATGAVRHCRFDGQVNYGIGMQRSGVLVIEDNLLENIDGAGVAIVSPELLYGRNNLINNCGIGVFAFTPGHLDFHDNHIFRRPGGLFASTSEYYPGEPRYIDLTRNYWGTTDLDELADGIFDGNDSDLVSLYFVIDPVADGPVPAERKSFGDVKALYR